MDLLHSAEAHTFPPESLRTTEHFKITLSPSLTRDPKQRVVAASVATHFEAFRKVLQSTVFHSQHAPAEDPDALHSFLHSKVHMHLYSRADWIREDVANLSGVLMHPMWRQWTDYNGTNTKIIAETVEARAPSPIPSSNRLYAMAESM